MTHLLLDTHSVIWFAMDDERLSKKARDAIADELHDRRAPAISVITMVEVVCLAEKRRVPADTFSSLEELSKAGRLAILPIDMAVVEALASLDRGTVPDMPDRIIAATALCRGVPFATRDERIRCALPKTIW